MPTSSVYVELNMPNNEPCLAYRIQMIMGDVIKVLKQHGSYSVEHAFLPSLS